MIFPRKSQIVARVAIHARVGSRGILQRHDRERLPPMADLPLSAYSPSASWGARLRLPGLHRRDVVGLIVFGVYGLFEARYRRA